MYFDYNQLLAIQYNYSKKNKVLNHLPGCGCARPGGRTPGCPGKKN
jgi:hypothetical protein